MTVHPGLNAEQQQRLRTLFDEAIDLPSSRWSAFLAESTADDAAVSAELASLLNSYERSWGFFERLSSQAVATAIAALDQPDDEQWAAPGQEVLHYQLIERIGGGGMGVVYKARDTRLDRIVALKFLPRRHDSNPGARARLLAEARAASALDHANIGVVYEITHTEDDRPFIAMAWYEGETLKALIRKKRLTVRDSLSIARQLAGALKAAHTAGIVHRDVKPANVIITSAGTAKLVDFGIAKLSTADELDAHAAGTIGYMSPEQTRGESVDFRTDIWSLGVVLYEMLCGQRPFQGQSDSDLIDRIRNTEARPFTSLRDDVSVNLWQLVAKCLAKNPGDRFQSAAALESELEKVVLVPARHGLRVSLPAAAAALALIAVGIWGYLRADKGPPAVISSSFPVVSVLPFTVSGQADSASELLGPLSDELRSELARSPAIVVSSSDAARTYEGSSLPLREIASALSSDYVVRGVMTSTGSKQQLRLFLLERKSERTLLDTTLDASFQNVSRIARSSALAVLNGISVPLSRDDRRRYETPPTGNALAYNFYLRARGIELGPKLRDMFTATTPSQRREAQALYAQARALDPKFADARARLAHTHLFSATASDTTRARLEQARMEAEAALRTDSLLAEGYEALSGYWAQVGHPDSAIALLERGLRMWPNHVGLTLTLASRYVALGRWEEGIAQYEKVMRLDPRNPRAYWLAATTFGRMRRQDRGMVAFAKVLEIYPDNHLVRIIRGQSWLRWQGTVDTLLAAADAVPKDWDHLGMKTFARYTGLMVQRRFGDIPSMLDASSSEVSRDGLVYHPKALMRAEAHRGLGDSTAARRYFEIARRQIEDSIAVSPRNASMHSALALVYSGLGRKREAMAAAERAMQLVPYQSNTLVATAYMGLAVETYARVGELDRAFEMIELLLTLPSGREITVPYLEVWPGFDPLRNDPRFSDVLKRFPLRFPAEDQ